MHELIEKLVEGRDLTSAEMESAIDTFMKGDCEAETIERFLLTLRDKGESIDEVVGAARAMRKHMTPIRTQRGPILDTCGTGGAKTGTFNISTAAAIVAAAAGAVVAKHGNRKVSSHSGSADVLTELGVNIEANRETVEKCLDEVGVCFCFAQSLHPSMKHVAAVRKKLAVPTIFNLLGPLCNPAGARYQLLGVGRPELRPLIAAALAELGCDRAMVVHGSDGLCEVTNQGVTDATMIAGSQLVEKELSPADFGLPVSDRKSLLVDSPADSARLIRRVFSGESGPPRDIVVMNAALALWLLGELDTLAAASERAARAIDEGKAEQTLTRLAEVSHQ